MGERPDEGVPRRRVLEILGTAFGVALTGGTLAGGTACSRGSGRPDTRASSGSVVLPVDRFPLGQRIVVDVDGTPAEVLSGEGAVTVRSLRCTHFGCQVEWKPDREQYVCPCHDGVFDSEGRVVYGPPDKPLPELRAEREGESLRIWPPANT